jgi:hypothetical protein
VVLAELASSVAEWSQQFGNRRILQLQAEVSARQPDLGKTGADGRLAGDERGAAGGAALLTVPVRARIDQPLSGTWAGGS